MKKRHSSKRFLAVAVLLWSLPLGAQVEADTSSNDADGRNAALVLGNRAADAIARGEHTVAEQLLRQAYEQYPAPTFALLHARTLVHLQRLAAAANAYQSVISSSLSPGSPDAFRRAVEQARSESAQLLPRVPRLQVVVRGEASSQQGLRLQLDGRPLPEAQQGRWVLVDPGRRVVSAELDGETSAQVVRIEERQSVVVEVSAPPSVSSTYRAASWTALGVGVAGVGTGVVAGLLATSAHSEAEQGCLESRCVEGSEGARDLGRFRSHRVISTLGYALGAVGLGVGGFLLVRGRRSPPTLRMEVDRQTAFLHWGGAL